MVDGERRDDVAAVAHLLVRLQLGQLERVAGAPDHRPHRLDQRAQPGRPVERERPLARAQVERLEHAEQPEPVVEVVVRDEDRIELGQPDRAQQLLLGPLAAVEQQPVAAGAQQQRGQPAPRRGHRAGRAGEEEREIHRTRTLEPLERMPALRPSSTSSNSSRPSRAVASPIVCAGARLRSVGEPGLKMWKPRACSCSGRCEWPNTTASASGKRRRRRASRPVGRPAVVGHHDPRALRLDDAHRRQPQAHLRLVDVAVHRVDRRPERLQQLEHLERDQVARVQDRVGGAQPRHARLRQRARAPGHVRVADDRELQARQEGFEPPTSASGGQRSIH